MSAAKVKRPEKDSGGSKIVESEPKKESELISLWKRLSSMKFALYVLILLGIASLVCIALGELFPANTPGGLQYYFNKFGEPKFSIYRSLGVFSPYRSFWYRGILALLSVSLTVCTLRRIPLVWRAVYAKNFKENEKDILDLKVSKKIETKKTESEIFDILKRYFKKTLYRIRIEEKNGKTLILASKGGAGRFGALIMHCGFVIALVGGLITSIAGYSVYSQGGEGSILSVPERDFQVRIDSFEIVLNEQGQVKDYLCGLTVIEGGEEVRSKIIEVNRPLRYEGINFYQSSYVPDDRNVKTAMLALVKKGFEDELIQVKLEGDSIVPVEGADFSLQMVDFAGNFLLTEGEVISDPHKAAFENPAVNVNVFEEGELIKSGWVFIPQRNFHGLLENYAVALIDFEVIYQTVINITENPGAFGIWIGITLMTIGVLLAFYVRHRKIWMLLTRSTGSRSSLVYGAVTNKHYLLLEKDMKEIANQVRK